MGEVSYQDTLWQKIQYYQTIECLVSQQRKDFYKITITALQSGAPGTVCHVVDWKDGGHAYIREMTNGVTPRAIWGLMQSSARSPAFEAQRPLPANTQGPGQNYFRVSYRTGIVGKCGLRARPLTEQLFQKMGLRLFLRLQFVAGRHTISTLQSLGK